MFLLNIIAFLILGMHPVHLSVVNIEYNPQKKKFEVSVRVFINDFEKIIDYKNNVSLNLYKSNELSDANRYINQYVYNHLQLKVNGNIISQKKYILTKRKKEDVTLWLYYDIKYSRTPKTIEVSDKLMTDLYRDQKNLLIFTAAGKQYPFEFNKKNYKQSITLSR